MKDVVLSLKEKTAEQHWFPYIKKARTSLKCLIYGY